MHYEPMHGAHYVVPGKECNIQKMLILGDYLGIESVGYTSEISTSKYNFLFL